MNGLQVVKNVTQDNKYDEILSYLKQDNCYWLDNDIWDIQSKEFQDIAIKLTYNVDVRYIDLSYIENVSLKSEVKYYLVYNLKNGLLSLSAVINTYQFAINHLVEYINQFTPFIDSFSKVNIEPEKWKLILINKGFKVSNDGKLSCSNVHKHICSILPNFFKDLYDNREETEKDIWYVSNIPGAKIRATQSRQANRLNFTNIPGFYRDMVKRYFKTIITKKSFSVCFNMLVILNYFFNYFAIKQYPDGYIENLSRQDIEDYIFYLINERKSNNRTETTKYVAWVRTFLEYIQMAQYDKAPIKEVAYLIFQDDIPKRELNQDVIKRVKFIPEPILKRIDNNIKDLDKPDLIPIYILLRETGWRGTDILNLRYDNCLEKIWNKKEDRYNCYLSGEITKTGIAQLKIPIRDTVAEMVEKCICVAREMSSKENNPRNYLFNIYKGRNIGKPISKGLVSTSINKLIAQKNITDANGKLYHFKMHSLRHTRAKEYVEQGMGISVIQQILGHRSLQMTVHYATVTENTLYEKWKQTEDLDLFRVDASTNNMQQVDINSKDGENLVRYEYVKKNLDAVKVPFGICFKPSKLACKQQMNHCLTCASFCTTIENVPEFEDEIENVKKQIEISLRYDRELWVEKNKAYLKLLEDLLEKVKQQKVVHENGASREDFNNG